MIYGNVMKSNTITTQTISFYENTILKECIVFESFLKEDSSMILEANLGESVKKSIPEKIRKLWTKLKTKLLDLLRKLKKKRVDTSSTEEDKTITLTIFHIRKPLIILP